MKKFIYAAIVLFAISCTKNDTNPTLLAAAQTDTSFITQDKAIKFTIPEPGFRIDYKIEKCKSALIELNTSDGRGWKSLQVAINSKDGLLFFMQDFRYRYNITRNDGSNWISSERVCTF